MTKATRTMTRMLARTWHAAIARGAVALCVLAGAGTVGAVASHAAAQSASDKVDNGARVATARQLARSITVELVDARLEDVITFIRDYSGAAINAAWADEDASGVGLNKDQRITVSVTNVSVLTLLERVLEKSRTDLSPATWQFENEGGAIEIGPRTTLNRGAYLKLYDIQDMLFEIPSFTDAPELDLDQVLNQSSQGGGGGGGGSVFGDTESEDVPVRSQQALAEQVIGIITDNVETEQWQDNGGDGATIRFYNGALLVRAPDYIHRQIGGYPFDMKNPGGTRTRITPGATPGAAPRTNPGASPAAQPQSAPAPSTSAAP